MALIAQPANSYSIASMTSSYLLVLVALACCLRNSAASIMSVSTFSPKELSTTANSFSMETLPKPSGTILSGHFTYIGYSDSNCKYVSSATSAVLNTCTPTPVGNSFMLVANSTLLITTIYSDLSCEDIDSSSTSKFAFGVCGPGYISYLSTTSFPEIKSSDPILVLTLNNENSTACSTEPAYKEYFATTATCISGVVTSISGTIARQDSYETMDCTGEYSTATHALDACVSPTESGLLVDSKWTYFGTLTTSPSTSPSSLNSPSSTLAPLVPSSGSTSLSPSASVVPSSGSISSAVPTSGSISSAVPSSGSISSAVPTSGSTSSIVPTSGSISSAAPSSGSISSAAPSSGSTSSVVPTSGSISSAAPSSGLGIGIFLPDASVAPSSGVASPSASAVPSSGVASPSAAPGQLEEGFIVMTRYTDTSCNVFAKASAFRLNNCANDGKGHSNIATLSSNSLKVKSFSDTTCTTEIGAKAYTYTDACIDSLRYSISSTGVPSLTVPSVSLRSYTPTDSSCTSFATQVETLVVGLCYDKVIVSALGVTLKYSTYQTKNCTGIPQVTLGIARKCGLFNSLYAMATVSESSTSSSASSKSSAAKKGCFAGSETVNLESGQVKFISDVRTGDRVLAADAAGRTFYSDVVFVPHRANSDDALFTHITTASGRDIKMTPSHIILSGPCHSSASLPLTYASSVSVGECVMTVSGEDMVSAVETVQGRGLYTVVTNEEFVVVNGIIASPFAINHMLANLCYNLHRFAYASLPSLLNWSLLHSVNEAIETSIFLQRLST